MSVADEDSVRPARARAGTVLMTLLIMGAAAAMIGANTWKQGLTVREVQTRGNRILSRQEVLSLAAIPRQQKLYAVDLSAACRRIESNPFVRKAFAVRDVPGRITIIVEERAPIAALVTDRLLYVDADGMVLPAARSEYIYDLPLITGSLPDDCLPGRMLTAPSTREALQLLVAARTMTDELYRGISEVHLRDDRTLLLYTAENGVPVIVGRGDLPAKLAKLDAFWKEFVSQRGAQELSCIDLRFEDQVVVRWQPQAGSAMH